ncbi:MAG TPA: transporter, partial [Thermoanaerobaculia bacterium]|nr:transporter [Thermoanaerobaculia bacterium]
QDFSGLDDPLITDRPDFTESTDTVPLGHFQLEGGFTSTRVDDEDSRSLGELLLRVGLSDRLEARIGAGSHTRIDGPGGDVSGYEDPSLGVKIRLSPETEMLPPLRPTVALILATSVPVGDDELTSDEWVPEAKLGFSWALTERFGLATNLNWAYPPGGGGGGDDRFHQFSGSLSGALSFTDRIGGYLEYFGFTEEEEGGPGTHYLNTGVTYLISNDLQLDLRYGRGLNDPDPDDFVGIGASVRW